MILTIRICPFWLLTKYHFLSFKFHQPKIMTRFPFDFSIYLSHPDCSSLQFSLIFFFFYCIDSQSQSMWSPTIFSFFFFFCTPIVQWSPTNFFFLHKLKAYDCPLPPLFLIFFFHSHSQNNLLRHHQLVFYFIFKRKRVKSK